MTQMTVFEVAPQCRKTVGNFEGHPFERQTFFFESPLQCRRLEQLFVVKSCEVKNTCAWVHASLISIFEYAIPKLTRAFPHLFSFRPRPIELGEAICEKIATPGKGITATDEEQHGAYG